jgi:hypothetical protein
MKKIFAVVALIASMPMAASADYFRTCSVADITNDVGICSAISDVTPLQAVRVCVDEGAGIVSGLTEPGVDCQVASGGGNNTTDLGLGALGGATGPAIALLVVVAAAAAAGGGGGTNGTN